MNRDPLTFNKNTKIMAKLLAEIINDFFEPLSYKTITLVAMFFFVLILISECIFSRTRHTITNGNDSYKKS
jgi:hypothetical protein